ncbi:MAG: anthranilate synthase component I family protein [Sphingobacterium sp.]
MAEAIFETALGPFIAKALTWSRSFEQVALFQSNVFPDRYSKLNFLMAVGARDEFSAVAGTACQGLEEFRTKNPNQWMPGFLSYDLKNEIEALQSRHENLLDFPDAYFFVPKIVIQSIGQNIIIQADHPRAIFQAIINTLADNHTPPYSGVIKTRMIKGDYMEAFGKLKQHIKQGDIYEANLCQEFYGEGVKLDNPEAFYLTLNQVSPTPFSAYFKLKNRYILCASPERFLARRGRQLISQPIKGTAVRGRTPQEDTLLKQQLINSTKEVAENVMIVDLVRNDLTRSALPGTVEVAEKLGVYSFQQVHQMISTVVCQQAPTVKDRQIIRHTFPPGSMTGAPKISAMQLCDRYENSRRGVYSGSLGYFAPDGDFDFNVVIRSLLYNDQRNYLSFHTGSAITVEADAEQEYQECNTKASAIFQALGQKR